MIWTCDLDYSWHHSGENEKHRHVCTLGMRTVTDWQQLLGKGMDVFSDSDVRSESCTLDVCFCVRVKAAFTNCC